MKRHCTGSSSRVLFVALAAALAATLLASVASMQAKKPISRKGLVDAVKINGLCGRAPRNHRGRALELPPARDRRRADALSSLEHTAAA
jgi:hypothetical protein